MKFITLILAFYVLLLSALPTFVEDKCMQEHTTEQGQNGQEDQNCNKGCCSPFFSCNTCTGFVLTTFHFSVTHSVKEPQRKLGTMPTPPVYNFPFSVWHPPQLV